MATSSGSSKTAAAVSPAAAQPRHSGPRLRSAIADVGHSSDTKTSSAAPLPVRSSRLAAAGSTPTTDSAGAGWFCNRSPLPRSTCGGGGMTAPPPRIGAYPHWATPPRRASGSLSAMTSAASTEPAFQADPPSWFLAALEADVQTGSVTVDGTPISYRAFGPPADSGIVLVHGGAAHARWWDHIAPLLVRGTRVVAFDLSGHGDSGRRDVYTLDHWAHEVLAVSTAAGITGPPVVIGHSMGGFVALRVAGLYGAQIEGVVVIDSPVRDITPEERAARDQRAFGPLRVYPTREAAIARFHPIPDQSALPYITAHLAAASILAADGG